MKRFEGFPDNSQLSPTAFPALFFTELVPMIDDLAELKVTIYSFWALNQKEGDFRYLLREEYDNPTLLEGIKVAKPKTDPQVALENALARAIARCSLLCTTVPLDTGEIELFCMNTKKGRVLVSQIQAGYYQKGINGRPIEILPERPNIYKVYEENIGMVDSAMIADALKDAEQEYPAEWVVDAIRLAVEMNKRSWRYISAILKRWKTEGKNDEFIGGYAERNGEEYFTGQYARFIKR